MLAPGGWVTVGIDNGGTANNGTVLDDRGRFLVDTMAELPSLVREGPDKAIAALVDSFDKVLAMTSVPRGRVRAVGLDTPGPASATGVLMTGGATNFGHPDWSRFDIRGALEARLGIPVVYNNDGNAAALYAHHVRHGADAGARGSVSVIVGTGCGAGVIHDGRVIRGAAGMAGELGHMMIPLEGLLEADQTLPSCNCGQFGDADAPGVRAIILVAADLISDTCGFAVPFMDYQGERTLHSDFFGRKTDEQFAAYCATKPHNAVSLDGLPALPLPLPARSH